MLSNSLREWSSRPIKLQAEQRAAYLLQEKSGKVKECCQKQYDECKSKLDKETTGVGDFVGTAGRPTPMAAHEVEKMLFDSRQPEETPIVKLEFERGDNVTIKEGPFENYEGTVDEVMPDKGLVRVLVTIFGRQAPIELEYWQIQKAEG